MWNGWHPTWQISCPEDEFVQEAEMAGHRGLSSAWVITMPSPMITVRPIDLHVTRPILTPLQKGILGTPALVDLTFRG